MENEEKNCEAAICLIAEIRRANYLLRKALSDATGVTSITISRWLDKNSKPSKRDQRAISAMIKEHAELFSTIVAHVAALSYIVTDEKEADESCS